MRGLLLKDLYVLWKNCRAYLVIMLLLIATAAVGDGGAFFVFYPCVFAGMIPMTLLGYDERSRWNEYCGTLPTTKGQIVSGKYLIGLGTQAAVLLLVGLTQGIRMGVTGSFSWYGLGVLMAVILTLSCVSVSISLPFLFRWGAEKGRVFYYVMIGAICGGAVMAGKYLPADLQPEAPFTGVLLLLCGAAVALYALSWRVSILCFQKREL